MQQESKSSVSRQLFEKEIIDIENSRCFGSAIRSSAQIYDIKNFKIESLTPCKIRSIYQCLQLKYSQNMKAITGKHWLENERRLYLWLVVCYMYRTKKHLRELTLSDYEIFSEIFNGKSVPFLKFQAFGLLKTSTFKRWTKAEDEFLSSIVNSIEKQNEKVEGCWNQISRRIFFESDEKYYRGPKQCRERWLNHLDKQKVKGKWTSEQDLILLESVNSRGKRWAAISVELNNEKNEHMVKNRYHSLIKKCSKENEESIEEEVILEILIRKMKSQEKTPQPEDSLESNGRIDAPKFKEKQQLIDEVFEEEEGSSQQPKNRNNMNQLEKNYQKEETSPKLELQNQQKSFESNHDLKPLEEKANDSNKKVYSKSPIVSFTPSHFWIDDMQKNPCNFSYGYSSHLDMFIGQR